MSPQEASAELREAVCLAARYVIDQTRNVIESFGPRSAGSEGERKAQELVKEELRKCADGEVQTEDFPVSPTAFQTFPRTLGIIMLAAFVLHWIDYRLSVVASALGTLVFVLQFLLYKRFLDPVFPKTISCNVEASRAPSGSRKRRVILNGHPDAAYEWRWQTRYPAAFKYIGVYCVAGMFAEFFIGLLFLVHGPGAVEGFWLALRWSQLALMPACVLAILFTDTNRVVPGANDNLSGTFTALAVLKLMSETGIRLENTEVTALITGSEEAGLRGAKDYVERHARELNGVETVVISLDTMRDLDHLYVYNRDMNQLVKHDPRACRLLQESLQRCGINHPYAGLWCGSTDATAFSQAGIPAVALCAMDPSPAHWYHSRRDNWDIMDPACIEKTLEILLDFLRTFDKNGLA